MAPGRLTACWRSMLKKKVFSEEKIFSPSVINLHRCLNLCDLIALGLGSILGVGLYVLLGSVALEVAGPSIVLSLLIAALAAFLAGLCFAELGARVPKAGSSYTYAYVTVGQFIGFIIGWSNILELLLGASCIARGMSLYVNSVTNDTMVTWLRANVPVGTSYFDPLAFSVVCCLAVILSFGIQESSWLNRVLVALNMSVILFVILVGSSKASWGNWNIAQDKVPAGSGKGGFFPYGPWGMMRGAAILFYGFVGFEGICASGEEVKNPTKIIPMAIILVLFLVFLAYAGVGIIVTMMVPYFLLTKETAVASVFTQVGLDWARWIVTLGALVGMCASLFGAMYPLPRILYSMAADGLMLPCFMRLNRRGSPFIATIIPASLTAILAALIELDNLVTMLSVGTLLSYTIVAICVLVLRYSPDPNAPVETEPTARSTCFRGQVPTRRSSIMVKIFLTLFVAACVSLSLLAKGRQYLWAGMFHAAAFLLMLLIGLQPTSKLTTFQTPLVPVVPCLSIFANVILMVLISVQSWIRVIIWVLVGIVVYTFFVCFMKQPEEPEPTAKGLHVLPTQSEMIQINVETPPPTPALSVKSREKSEVKEETESVVLNTDPDNKVKQVVINNYVTVQRVIVTDEIKIHQAVIDYNEEKEAKIIDLLDQVLQAEEDSYGEVTSLAENKDDNVVEAEQIPHRPSLSELSEADSDASLSNIPPSKYDVVAQVHREDLPRVNEEPETFEHFEQENDCYEQVTFFNVSETSSRTDESGYSDTTDNNNLLELEEKNEVPVATSSEDIPKIPTPPPLPPPIEEYDGDNSNYFTSPNFKKAYTISSRPSNKSICMEEDRPRESVQSNASVDDNNIVFGSVRQLRFMSKLDNIFQKKVVQPEDDKLKRSNSMGNVIEDKQLSVIPQRPALFLDLKKEILAKDTLSLRHVKRDKKKEREDDSDEMDSPSLSRDDLKMKLENILAAGGPKLLKPRLMKSNPPTPEEAYHTYHSSTESIPKLPKMEKNDTLKRQKDKFGEVLNSFKMNLNAADDV